MRADEHRAITGVVAFSVLLHVVVNATSAYGFHRDEFLYLAMGRHLDLWRMDFPPFIALIAKAQLQLLGDSVVAVRLAPALAGAALILLAALLARALGGGRFAQALAMLSVLAHPLFLRTSTLFQPVVFDQLWWTLGYFALARLSRDPSPRWWLTLGAAAGLGLLTKFSIVFFGVGVVAAVLVTPLRDALRTRWPWAALLLALILGAPSIVGQIALDWPLREQMAGLREAQLARVTWGEFIGTQFLFGPATLLAGAGLAVLLGGRLREFRVIGVATLTSFALLLVLRGKPYYAGPIYPVLFAAGAVLIESLRAPSVARALRWSTAGIIATYGLLTLPIGLPVLPPATMARYAARSGMTAAVRTNRGELLELPQDYADMLGWERQVAAVARVFDALPPRERQVAAVMAGNYGQAGALDHLGARLALPPAISPAGTYWQFGPGDRTGEVLVTVGIEASQLRQFYDSVVTAATVNEPWVVPEERNVEINVARGPRMSLAAAWPLIGPNYQ